MKTHVFNALNGISSTKMVSAVKSKAPANNSMLLKAFAKSVMKVTLCKMANVSKMTRQLPKILAAPSGTQEHAPNAQKDGISIKIMFAFL